MIIVKVPAKITLFGEYIVSFGKEGAAISIDKWVIAQIEESKKEDDRNLDQKIYDKMKEFGAKFFSPP